MSTLLAVGPQFFTLIVIVLLGILCRKKQWMDDAFDAKLTKIILYISCPCLLVASVLKAEDLPGAGELLLYLGISTAGYVVLLVLGWLISKFLAPSKGLRGTFTFMIAFGNIVFFGLPVSTAVFGAEAAVYVAIISVPFNILVFSVGAYLIARDGADTASFVGRGAASVVKGLVTKPINIASVLCLILALVGAHGGGMVLNTLDTVGSLTLPAALFVIGSSLGKYNVRSVLGGWRTAVVVALRLLVVPVATFLLLKGFIGNQVFLGTLMLLFAMPVATNGTLICIQYGVDLKSITSGTFVSNVASIIAIPLLCMLLL